LCGKGLRNSTLASTSSSAKLNKHLIAFDFHFVSDRVLRSRHCQRFAGANIELGEMTRAFDLVIGQFAFAERSAVVRADIVQAKEFASNVKQYYDLVIDLEQLLAGIGDIGCLANGNEVRHEQW
jgi:hypothetical protein